MRVHLIRQKTIDNYVLNNANGQIYFDEWLSKLKAADWESPADIKSTYHRADLLGNGSRRVIFNIGGNNYRLICKYAFGENEVHLFVCWIGTHAEYTRLCMNKDQYSINLY
jgi:mRNA interferase HigB